MVNLFYSLIKCYSRKISKIKNFNFIFLLTLVILIIYCLFLIWPDSAYDFKNGQLTVNSLLTEQEYNNSLTVILNNEYICEKNKTIFSLVIINSSINNYVKRNAIRNSWSQWLKNSNSRLIFLLSKSNNNFLQRQIELENYYYNDIIQYNTTDSYYLLTFKTLSNLHWAYNFCPNTKYLIKCDDDVFVNWPKVNELLKEHINEKQTIYGDVSYNKKPIRFSFTRQYMPYSEYKENIYPSFANGPFYIMTFDVVPSLIDASKKVKPIYLEDVYFTGILREHLNIEIVNIKNLIINYMSLLKSCSSNYIYSFHKTPYHQMENLFQTLNESESIFEFLKNSCHWVLNKMNFVS